MFKFQPDKIYHYSYIRLIRVFDQEKKVFFFFISAYRWIYKRISDAFPKNEKKGTNILSEEKAKI